MRKDKILTKIIYELKNIGASEFGLNYEVADEEYLGKMEIKAKEFYDFFESELCRLRPDYDEAKKHKEWCDRNCENQCAHCMWDMDCL